jgi:hypothetical protein
LEIFDAGAKKIMAEITIEQQRALALAQARKKKAEQEEKENRKLTPSEIAGSAFINFLPSLYRNVVEPVVERPGQTAKAAAGLLTEAVLGTGPSPQTAQAIRQDYSEAYGTPENFMRTIAEDPARPILDLSLLGTGVAGGLRAGASSIPRTSGRAVRARSALSQAADVTQKAAEVVDPFAIAGRGLDIAGQAGSAFLGTTTGTGQKAVQEAYRAGRAGDETGQAFYGQMMGESADPVIASAKQALENIRANRSRDYRSGMVNIKNDKSVLDFKEVDQTLANIRDRGFFKGKQIDRSAADTWQKIDDLVQEWKTANPAEFHTPEGLDALKKAIGDVRDTLPFGTPARNVANNAYGAVRKQITDQAPGYAKVMKEYEEAATLINEIEGTLSLGKKAQADQSLRKLQSILRNNAYTAYGKRTELGEELVKSGATNLMPQLAGQAFQPLAPRGLVGQGTLATLGTSALSGNFSALPAMALTSPRVVGETAYRAGRVAGSPAAFRRQLSRYGARLSQESPEYAMAVDMANRALQVGGEINPLIARQLTAQFGRFEDEEKRKTQ